MDPLIYYRLYPEFRSRSWQRHSAHTRLMDYLIRKANPAQSQICGIDFPPGTILISSRQYCEQTGEHPQLFAYALRDLQYEGDIAVTLIGHTLIVTLTHYPTPAPAPEAPPSPQPATFSEPIPEATPEPAAPEETPSPQPPSSTDPVPSLSATCTARINIQHSKFPIQKESPHPLTASAARINIQNSTFHIQKESPHPLPASAARTTFKIQHSKFKTPPEPGRPPP